MIFFYLGAPIALILSGVMWMLSGGDQGASVEMRFSQNYFVATNINVLGRALANAALGIFGRAPLPPPRA